VQLLLVFWYSNLPLAKALPSPLFGYLTLLSTRCGAPATWRWIFYLHSLCGDISTHDACTSQLFTAWVILDRLIPMYWETYCLLARSFNGITTQNSRLTLSVNMANTFFLPFREKYHEGTQNTCTPFALGLQGRRGVFVRKPFRFSYDDNSEGPPNSSKRWYEVPRVLKGSGRGV